MLIIYKSTSANGLSGGFLFIRKSNLGQAVLLSYKVEQGFLLCGTT